MRSDGWKEGNKTPNVIFLYIQNGMERRRAVKTGGSLRRTFGRRHFALLDVRKNPV
jgi:hypothetical protein